MSAAVNLLLLLSALLSALTGAQAGSRPAHLAVAVARTAAATEVARVDRKSTAPRPTFTLPKLVELAWADPLVQPVGPALLFLSRRRE